MEFATLPYIAAAVEVLLILWALIRLSRILRRFRATPKRAGFQKRLESALAETFGNTRLMRLVSSEITLFYYLLIAPFRTTPCPSDAACFSSYKTNSYRAIFFAFLFALTVETVALHFILAIWSSTAAWIATALSIYALFWLLGDFQTLRLLPTIIEPNTLHLRLGSRYALSLPRSAITLIKRENHDTDLFAPKEPDAPVKIAPTGSSNVYLELDRAYTAKGPFGGRVSVQKVRFFVDDAEGFFKLLSQKVAHEQNG